MKCVTAVTKAHFTYLRDLIESFCDLVSFLFQMRNCMMPTSYTPSAQEKVRAMMWKHWCWRSCLRCWRSSVDISYLYLAGMNSLVKVCFNWGIGQQMKKKKKIRGPCLWSQHRGGWARINGNTGPVGAVCRNPISNKTKKGNVPSPFLSNPLLSLPLFYVTNVPRHMGLSKVYPQRLLVPLPLIFRSYSIATLGLSLQHSVRESWFQ